MAVQRLADAVAERRRVLAFRRAFTAGFVSGLSLLGSVVLARRVALAVEAAREARP